MTWRMDEVSVGLESCPPPLPWTFLVRAHSSSTERTHESVPKSGGGGGVETAPDGASISYWLMEAVKTGRISSDHVT